KLAQVNRPPQPPRHKARKIEPEDLCDSSPLADGGQLTKSGEDKRLSRFAADRGRDVARQHAPLSQRVLCGGWVRFSTPGIGNRCAIPDRPYSRPAGYFHTLIRGDPTAILSTGNRFDYWVWRCSRGPDQCLRGHKGPIAERDCVIAITQHPRVESD